MSPIALSYLYVSGRLTRLGRSDLPYTGPGPGTNPVTSRDSLVYGEYLPDATTTGVYPGTVLTDYNASTVNNVTLTSGGEIKDKRIYGDIKMSSATDLTLRNCELVGGMHVPTGASGVVDCNNARAGRLTLIDCTIIPRRPSLNRDCVVGHRWRAYRCTMQRGVDAMGAFITTNKYSPQVNSCDVIAKGNWVSNLAYGYPDYTNGSSGAAQHTDGTHNDGFQHQGGLDVLVEGNFFDLTATANAEAGTNPAKPWLIGQGYANGSCMLTQNNTGTGADGTVQFLKNWARGGLYHFNAKPVQGVVYKGNKHYRATAVSPDGATGTHRGYWVAVDNRANTSLNGIQTGELGTNVWLDGPYAGQTVAEPRDAGIHFYA